MSKAEQAVMNDNKLMDLATYAVTDGLTKIVSNPEVVGEKFAEFKRYIKRGSFTMKQLEDSVAERWGVVVEE